MEFDRLYESYKTRVDYFIDQCEILCYNPSLEQYISLKRAFSEAYELKKEMRQLSKDDDECRQKFREVLKYKHFLIPEFEPIRIFEQVIKLRQKREDLFNEIAQNCKNDSKQQKYLLTLEYYCKTLDAKEMATKLNQNFPRETKMGIPSLEKLYTSKIMGKSLEC